MDCPSPPGKGWYALLALPATSALLALQYHHFALKAGVAGGGILILVLLQVRSARAARDAWMILGAFLFSIGGDWFLSHRHGLPERFLAGIGLFFLAHVGYLAFSLMNGRLHRGMTLIVLAGYLALFFLKIRPAIHSPLLLAAVLGYLLISCFSLGAAAGLQARPAVKWPYVCGIGLVLFSDTLIAFSEFAAWKEGNFLILPTYYLAQISITLAIMAKSRK